MKQKDQSTVLNLHLRFNSANARHQEAAEYLELVKTKYKAALVTAAIEAYRAQHPYGIDYQELEEIRRQTYRSFQPKKPIQKNLKKAVVPALASSPQAVHIPEAADNDTMDQTIALYGLDEDDESES